MVTTKEAKVTWTGEKQFLAWAGSNHSIVLDADRERNSGLSPMELLLMGLGGCTGVDVVNILKKKHLEIRDYEIKITGEQRDEYPKIYTKIKVVHVIRGENIPKKAVEDAVQLSVDKYCSVSAMLEKTADIKVEIQIEN